MITENYCEIKAVSKSLTRYERAFIKLASLLLEEATDVEEVETLAFMLEMLAQTLNAEIDRLKDVAFSLKNEL
jgi:hypothetical protein